MLNVVVDFEYGSPIIMVAHIGDKLFMKSEVKVSIPPRPYFNLSSNYSCTEKKIASWEDKVYNKIYEAVCKSFKESLYGEVFLTVKWTCRSRKWKTMISTLVKQLNISMKIVMRSYMTQNVL